MAGLVALSLFSMTFLGCQTGATRVMPAPGEHHKTLSADDVVLLMRQSGFGDSDILQYGTDLRNALATQGVARVEIGDVVRAIFCAQEESVYVTTSMGKAFFYPIHAAPKAG